MVAVGLGYDACVHLRLRCLLRPESRSDQPRHALPRRGGGAVLVALLVLVSRYRAVALFTVVIAGSALGAVLLYRYVDLRSLGPLPDMYEPSWYPEKTYSTRAEAAALVAAVVLVFKRRQAAPPRLMPGRGRHTCRTTLEDSDTSNLEELLAVTAAAAVVVAALVVVVVTAAIAAIAAVPTAAFIPAAAVTAAAAAAAAAAATATAS